MPVANWAKVFLRVETAPDQHGRQSLGGFSPHLHLRVCSHGASPAHLHAAALQPGKREVALTAFLHLSMCPNILFTEPAVRSSNWIGC